ncbi:MAG: c-type cytochrome [Steroidobacteraceae bacterium]|jgi:cytochrome c peroxidase|nr:c-type cytochrome [Steroidobacteraceae bacterium]
MNRLSPALRHGAIAAFAALLAAGLASCMPARTPSDAGARVSALPAVSHPVDNPGTPAKIALGQQLFVDPRLSGSGKMACQGCHYRQYGWTDAQVLSKRDDGKMNTRHTPTIYNVGYQTSWYWDGRSATLEAQVLAAWRNQTGADPAKVAALLNTIPGYASQFEAVFGGPATPETVVKALAAWLRALVSTDSPWDRYEQGQKAAVSKDAIAGYALFMGKGRCSACHTPPTYGNGDFHNVGLEAGKASPDPGRANVTKNPADTSAFKTPTLRSVALSAPYFHDGSVPTLEDAVRYMASGGKADPNKSPLLTPTGLTDGEIRQVVAFLKSLTSEERWEAPKLP